MTERTRCPVLHIPTDEVVPWYDSGWSFVEPAEVPGFSIIAWEHPGDPRQPFPTRASEAVA